MKAKPIALTLLLSLFAGTAVAIPMVTNDQATFNAATSGLSFTTENFDAFGGSGTTVDLGAFTVSNPLTITTDSSAFWCVSGSCLFFPNSSFPVTITFDNPVNAVSFSLGDVLDNPGNEATDAIAATVNGQILTALSGGPLPGSSDSFVGIYDLTNSFTTVVLTETPSGQNLSGLWGLDDLSYAVGGSPVPAPATFALLGLGLAGMRYTQRRKIS